MQELGQGVYRFGLRVEFEYSVPKGRKTRSRGFGKALPYAFLIGRSIESSPGDGMEVR